jgi:cholesterol transport system auxiliary component
MQRRAQAIVAAGMLAMLSGCGAARPPKFYTLEKLPAAAPAAAQVYPVSLMVGRLTAPQLLRGDRIVYGMSSVEMGVYTAHRWAEPPPQMIETMLIEKLRATGQYKSVQRLAGASRGDYILRGRLIALNEMDTPSGIVARFAMELELFQPKSGTVVWTQSYEHDEPVAKKTVNDVVEALQQNVEAGLQQLTAELGQYFASQATK